MACTTDSVHEGDELAFRNPFGHVARVRAHIRGGQTFYQDARVLTADDYDREEQAKPYDQRKPRHLLPDAPDDFIKRYIHP